MRRASRTRAPALCLVPLLLPLLLGGCRIGSTVVRVDEGRPVPGRWISPSAYASFLEGSLAEASGHLDAAAAHYHRVLDEDPQESEA